MGKGEAKTVSPYPCWASSGCLECKDGTPEEQCNPDNKEVAGFCSVLLVLVSEEGVCPCPHGVGVHMKKPGEKCGKRVNCASCDKTAGYIKKCVGSGSKARCFCKPRQCTCKDGNPEKGINCKKDA